jgi:two-component system chemotaxis response regulator CheY
MLLENVTILMVDDEPDAVNLLRKVLRGVGFSRMHDAASGADALAMMQQYPYDLVISDWNMEPMTGLELLREIRATPEMRQTLFIMITGQGDEARVKDARLAGVQGFILKPYSVDKVRKQVLDLLMRHHG